ncbi:MAG: NAD(P)-dependent alcohol dehydrogenase [Treponemataceae bacterium]
MKAVVLEEKGKIVIREIDVPEIMRDRDVKIKISHVGICGSDVHYYTHGGIGQYIVKEPMILGHEASGIIEEVGSKVTEFKKGDRVCMEPGIPNPSSRESRLGFYNLDREVSFWATPPIHGCLRSTVIHPADYTFKLADNISLAEGAMVEPLAIGLQTAVKAHIKPGDVAVVLGCGTIGLMCVASLLAGGCSKVIVTDTFQPKLNIAANLGAVIPVNISQQDAVSETMKITNGWGADIVVEASGNDKAAACLFDMLCPGGRVVYTGIPVSGLTTLDITKAQAREATIETVFRYAHIYPRALNLLESKKIDVKQFITDTYSFAQSVEAFEYVTKPNPTSVKIQIVCE